jgi:acyl-CoA thioesterase FadM
MGRMFTRGPQCCHVHAVLLGCAPPMQHGRHPKLAITPYTIRGIELDATGTVSPGWVARILEHTRWQAFTVDGSTLGRLMQGGVARAGTYEHLEPVRHGDELEIATWVARVGRTSFDFGHRIARLQDGTVVIRARMTIVHLGLAGPAPLDLEVSTFIVDEPAPAPRPWPEGDRLCAWTRSWTVRPSDQDSFGHVNQARYVDYIDDTRWFAHRAGQPAGLEGRLKTVSVEYVRETHAGERVQMRTWVTGEQSRAYELVREPSGEVLSRGQAVRDQG